MSQYQLALPDGVAIPYQLERRARRTIGMKVGAQGLVVHAPQRISMAQLEDILLSKADWILSKLDKVQQHTPPAVSWTHGAPLLLLGQDIQLHITQDTRKRKPQFNPAHYPAGTLLLATPEPADAAGISQRVIQWYRHYALADFARRLQLFATRLGVTTPALFLSNAQSRWGSCNSRQQIRLNWRLIQAPPHIINYVICHELAHLKEMNHSARFWAVVESLFPDYRQAERELKQLSAQLHAIG